MADYYTLLTTTGAAQLANAQATGTTVAIKYLAVGDGNGTAYDPSENQTALVNEVWRGQINQVVVDADNANWLVIEGIVPEDVGGWYVREVGVFDADGNLIAIGKYPETYKPALASGSAKDLYIRFILEISNTADVELKIDPAIVLASRSWVDALLAAHAGSTSAHPNATTEAKGFVELATAEETAAGEDTERAVTPHAFNAAMGLSGVAFLDAAQSWTKGQRGAPIAIDDTDPAIDLDAGNVFVWTLGGNATLPAPSNIPAGQSGVVWLIQDATGGRTLAYDAVWKFAGGTVPNLSTDADARDALVYETNEDGTLILASLVKGVA